MDRRIKTTRHDRYTSHNKGHFLEGVKFRGVKHQPEGSHDSISARNGLQSPSTLEAAYVAPLTLNRTSTGILLVEPVITGLDVRF
jgi:hypothetical protein